VKLERNVSYRNTKAALKTFDEKDAARLYMFDNARDSTSLDAWIGAEFAALDEVRKAFYEDVKYLNRYSLDDCMLLSLDFLRKQVETPVTVEETATAV
jgi:hypothetical protein